MKPLRDCEFTAFVSYAHADDAAWFDWVSQFRNELERSLKAMLRGTPLPRFHLSGENGPVAGMLSDELKQRIEQSFAMIIVVHDNYAQSDWCLKELEYFSQCFGADGLRQRLYIVAMSEAAINAVTASPRWRSLMPAGEQLWMPFFEPGNTARPLDIYLAPGLVAPAFRMPFERLRSDFAAKLKAAPPAGAAPLQAPAAAVAAAPVAAAAAAPVVMGFVPPAAADAAAAAAAALAERGVAVRALTRAALSDEFADFAAASHLVLPFDDTPLSHTAVAPGGHLELQHKAWLAQRKPADHVHWLDLRSASTPAPGWHGSAAYVATLGVECTGIDALAQRLAPAPAAGNGPSAGVRIYIESNRHERTLWEPLGDQIRRKWDRVCSAFAPARVPPLSLRTRGLPVDQIDAFPSLDDADGVVLLWGRKTSDALVAQINKVENKMTPGLDAAPGIVAYLMPPQQASEPVPAWGWQVLRFNAANEDDIDVVGEESDALERFLKKVFQRRLQREAQASG